MFTFSWQTVQQAGAVDLGDYNNGVFEIASGRVNPAARQKAARLRSRAGYRATDAISSASDRATNSFHRFVSGE